MVKMSAYRPRFVVKFAGKDITAVISEFIVSLEYSDYLDGQSDEVSVELFNAGRRWCEAWYPVKGDVLEIGLGYHEGEFVQFSDCELDTVEYGFKPDTVRLRALSTGVTKSVRTRKPKLYQNTTLAALAKTIAKRNKLALTGTILDVRLDKVSQYMERDLEFLMRIAKLYNHSFKIVGTKLVFTHKPDLADQPPVRQIDYAQVTSLTVREQLRGAVSTVDVAYQNPKTKKKQRRRYRKNNVKKSNQSWDTLKIIRRGADAGQTGQQAQAALSEANEDRCMADVTLLGDPKLVAGNTVELTGLGELSGKYLINCSRHRFSRDEGYITSLDLKRLYPEEGLEEISDDAE